MRLQYITLTFIITICFSAIGQKESSFQEEVLTYLSINGTEQQYREAYDQMFQVLRQQYNNDNVPETLWVALRNSKEKHINHIKSLLAAAYRSHFTRKDIQQMITFYKSDAGKQLVTDYTQLTKEQRAAFKEFTTSKVGQKIEEKREALSKDISQISEFWSRDLFKDTTEALKEKGYTTKYK